MYVANDSVIPSQSPEIAVSRDENTRPGEWHTAQQCFSYDKLKILFKITLILERMDNSNAPKPDVLWYIWP